MTNNKKMPADKAKVLLADDSESVKAVLKSLLIAMGFKKILLAKDGNQAVKMLGAQAFDLIICDWEMPGYQGDQILQIVRQSHNNSQSIFIMCTGLNETNKVKEAISLGVSNFITKPFNHDLIHSKLETYFHLPR